MLGIVPVEGELGVRQALSNGFLAPQILRQIVGYSLVSELAQAFAFFAILTSFLAVALSVTDLLADGFGCGKETRATNFFICLLTLVPPVIIGLTDPSLFLKGIKYAGGMGAVILYGLIPSIMAWRGRYTLKLSPTHILPGGKAGLILIQVSSVAIVTLHLIKEAMIN
jgi:tyrosine-specific transport protein